jgi:hypothetical protein
MSSSRNVEAGSLKRCAHCDKKALLVALHGDRGGPSVCLDCQGEVLALARDGQRREARRMKLMMRTLHDEMRGGSDGLSQAWERTFGSEPGDPDALADLLRSDVLMEAVSLTHPDLHPNRSEVATRVTAMLTAAREYASPPKSPKPPRDASPSVTPPQVDQPVTREPDPYPCDTCQHLRTIHLWCDSCRSRWWREREERLERDRAYRRDLRARNRIEPLARACADCGEYFTPSRADTRYCSDACRQHAYRERKRA